MSPIFLATSMALSEDFKSIAHEFHRKAQGLHGDVVFAADEFFANKANCGGFKGWPAFVAGRSESTGVRRYGAIWVPLEDAVVRAALDPNDPMCSSLPPKLQHYDPASNSVLVSSGTGKIAEQALEVGMPVVVVSHEFKSLPVVSVIDVPTELPNGKIWKAKGLVLGQAEVSA